MLFYNKYKDYLYIIFLTILPMPFGSARPFWQTFWVCCVIILTSLHIWFQGPKKAIRFDTLFVLIIAGPIGIVLWGALQVIAWPDGQTISVNPFNTTGVILNFFSHILWFFLVLATVTDQKKAWKIIRSIGFIGVAYAVYGFAIYIAGNEYILTFRKWAYPDSLTSTFVNRNNYAAYAGLALQSFVCWAIFAVYSNKRAYILSYGNIDRYIIYVMWLLLAVLLLVTTILLSSSRMGAASTMVAVLFLPFLAGIGKRHILQVYAAILLLLSIVLILSGGNTWQRLGLVHENDVRLLAYRDIITAIGDRPFYGFGLGNFEEAFASYRGSDIGLLFDRGHNDYLELALTAGLPASVAFASCIIILLVRLVKATRSALGGDRVLIALGVSTAIQLGLHATVDFPFQIPAISYTFTTVLACSYKTYQLNRESQWTNPDGENGRDFF